MRKLVPDRGCRDDKSTVANRRILGINDETDVMSSRMITMTTVIGVFSISLALGMSGIRIQWHIVRNVFNSTFTNVFY